MSNYNEWTENLENSVKVIVSSNHCFNTDTILLANFSMPKDKEKLTADLGSGCGTIPLFWMSKGLRKKIVTVEIQNAACELLKRSISLNNFQDHFQVINEDIKTIGSILPHESFDLVVCNPPYKKKDSGIQNMSLEKTICRHETNCKISDIINTSKKILKFSGRLCMCNRPERLVDVVTEMRVQGIEPKKIQFVQYNEKKPKLFLIEGKKGAHPGINVLPTLFTKLFY